MGNGKQTPYSFRRQSPRSIRRVSQEIKVVVRPKVMGQEVFSKIRERLTTISIQN